MKTTTTILAIMICLSVICGSAAVAVRPVECLIVVEKAKRKYNDLQTAQYVAAIIKEKQRELQRVHE